MELQGLHCQAHREYVARMRLGPNSHGVEARTTMVNRLRWRSASAATGYFTSLRMPDFVSPTCVMLFSNATIEEAQEGGRWSSRPKASG